MTRKISVKICGLSAPEHIEAAAKAGASYIGFVFFEKSPRNISLSHAHELALLTPPGLAKVALVVDASNAELDALTQSVPLDLLQLHGGETPERVAEIKARFGLPVMKALGVAEFEDLAAIDIYAEVADQLLVDAKAPKGAAHPGGNGLAFDWRILRDRKFWAKPWMLAGGLTPENVAEAVQRTGAHQVDVSSGVESTPGVKDSRLIAEFVSAARRAPAPHLT
ncbi:MAG: phosphoribosylanthranilate isomerase [Pseudomonadota bacterium]